MMKYQITRRILYMPKQPRVGRVCRLIIQVVKRKSSTLFLSRRYKQYLFLSTQRTSSMPQSKHMQIFSGMSKRTLEVLLWLRFLSVLTEIPVFFANWFCDIPLLSNSSLSITFIWIPLPHFYNIGFPRM